MSPVVVFILFAICLLIAVPVSITLGIVAVLPGALPPFGTSWMLMPSSRFASPDVPAISPFFAQPSQP